MPKVRYQGRTFYVKQDETVLSGLLRQGVELEHACRAGVCNACLVRASGFDAEQESLKTGNLAAELVESGHFLSCKTRIKGSIELLDPGPVDMFTLARPALTGLVVGKRWLGDGIVQLRIQPSEEMSYQAGQFVWLYHPDGQARPYSMAASPQRSPLLEFHIRRHCQGHVSRWLADELKVGMSVPLSLADGDCSLEDNMHRVVMIAFGIGLAPMAAISQQILDRHQYSRGEGRVGHAVSGHLLHIARDKSSLYGEAENSGLVDEIQASNVLDYTGLTGRSDLLATLASLNIRYGDAHWFLCGGSEAVYQTRNELLRLGVSSERMRFDPFESQPVRASTNNNNDERLSDELEPQPELWAWLDAHDRLAVITNDFYQRMLGDPMLSPYFGIHTARWDSRDTIAAFYQYLFTGKNTALGDQPLRDQHWMVHADELFDYQMTLMEQTLKQHRMPGLLITIWMSYEMFFRDYVLKGTSI
ncbi:2Fe-2S iron-sulfur cluster-binding protein [Oceanobacter sp. 3_MG-2023]|uniref:2Fe-2S iron-sulfur cluster-binding protein n=1 Tax=Oceanobacter sp. 3_MG-2023 TaxID=3062622 RepID=UPI0027323D2B|nr:2Fe-2S iron-sulfur cluster-binding protein [Oceanobacter sp. 3_MG-2023]MDP2507268.1 2Fe-2S iron-sulfur cluster-binding protein [Oceanobacter sp. 3_MG-2023]